MKKLLLGSVLSTALLLAACGGETEEDTSSEENNDTAELEQRIEDLESENEALQAENDELKTTIDETSAESSENANSEENSEDVQGDSEDIKAIASEVDETYDSMRVQLLDGGVSRVNVTEDEAWLFDTETEPGPVDMIALQFQIDNTVDEPRDFYFNYTTIVTNTNEQIESESYLSSELENTFLGEVTSTGAVIWVLEPGTAEDIEWIDIEVPAVVNADTYDNLTETQTIRVEFE